MGKQPAQRTCTEIRVKALLGEQREHLVRPFEGNLHLVLQATVQRLEQQRGDLLDAL